MIDLQLLPLLWVNHTFIASAVLGIFHLDVAGKILITGAAATYVLAVQIPTFLINIPLNNYIQSLDTNSMNESAENEARQRFEPRWNRWNIFRTVISCIVVVILIVVLYRL